MIVTAQQYTDWYRALFENYERTLNGGSKSSIHQIRRQAIAKFAELGFPLTNDEEWRFTNVAPMTKIHFDAASQESTSKISRKDLEQFVLDESTSATLVFVNGFFSEELSSISKLHDGVNVQNLANVLKSEQENVKNSVTRFAPFEHNAFTALNTAFINHGAAIVIPDGVVEERPIHLLYVATKENKPFMMHPRNVIIVGQRSQVSVVESYIGLDNAEYFTNAVTEISLGDGAIFEHDKLQIESSRAFHISSTHVQLNAASTFTSNSIALGGVLVRNNVIATFGAERGECTLNGLSVATGSQLIDNHTTIDHAMPRCNSHELYKSILDGKSRGVFNGKIFVRKDAQKTDAKQTNKTLLLSDEATIDTKPQLEIFADDVKCTHGATVGQLDEDQVFYLRARGIGLTEARDMLTFAFASDIANRIHVPALKERLTQMIQERLQKGRIEEL